MSEGKKFYTFKPEEKGLIRKAIENNEKNNTSNNQNTSKSKFDRKKRTEKFLYNLSKIHSKREIEELRKGFESMSDEEFKMLCDEADRLTNFLLNDNHDFNAD